MREKGPFLFWLLFSCILLMAILIIRPGWGLMDDTENLGFAKELLNSTNKLAAYNHFVYEDILGNGRFRPFYFVWIVSAYSLFHENPTGFYFFVLLLGLLFLPVWGKLLRDSYGKKYEGNSFVVWAYPVSFFLFTPFWNNFMYLSTLEKFIYFFSPLAFLSFLKVYQQRRFIPFIFAAGAGFFCLTSKETGIAVFMTFFIFCLISAVFCGSCRKLSIGLAVLNGTFLVGYYFLIRSIISGYSARYEGFSIPVIASHLIHGPAVIKLLFVFAVMSGSYFCWRAIKSGSVAELFPVLWPFFVITYLSVLSPWGYMNYLLAPLAPAVMAMFLPLYFSFWRTGKMKIIKDSLFGLACALCLFGLIVPRILQLASVKEVSAFLKIADVSSRYLFPAASMETPVRLSELSGKNIEYVKSGVITQKDLSGRSAYLILDPLCAGSDLIDVRAEKIVYRTNYWVIIRIVPAIGSKRHYQVNFPQTFVQRFVRALKNY